MQKLLIVAVVVVVVGVAQTGARPNYRVKRVSDAHLADLETRIALKNKYRGVALTMPVAGGLLDPARIGRKRRSQEYRRLDELFNRSDEDKSSSNSVEGSVVEDRSIQTDNDNDDIDVVYNQLLYDNNDNYYKID